MKGYFCSEKDLGQVSLSSQSERGISAPDILEAQQNHTESYYSLIPSCPLLHQVRQVFDNLPNEVKHFHDNLKMEKKPKSDYNQSGLAP